MIGTQPSDQEELFREISHTLEVRFAETLRGRARQSRGAQVQLGTFDPEASAQTADSRAVHEAVQLPPCSFLALHEFGTAGCASGTSSWLHALRNSDNASAISSRPMLEAI